MLSPDAGTIGVQDAWVYGEEEDKQEDIPLRAMTEEAIERKMAWLSERIRRGKSHLNSLGAVAVSSGGAKISRLVTEVEEFQFERDEVKQFLQQLNKEKLRNGGNRGRRKKQTMSNSTEWWDVPDNPTHFERMSGGGRRAARPTDWDPYLRGKESITAQESPLAQKRSGTLRKSE